MARRGLLRSWRVSFDASTNPDRYSSLGQVEPDLRLGDLWVVDVDPGLFRQKVVGDGDGGGFTG